MEVILWNEERKYGFYDLLDIKIYIFKSLVKNKIYYCNKFYILTSYELIILNVKYIIDIKTIFMIKLIFKNLYFYKISLIKIFFHFSSHFIILMKIKEIKENKNKFFI